MVVLLQHQPLDGGCVCPQWTGPASLPVPHPQQPDSPLCLMWVWCKRKVPPLRSVRAEYGLVSVRHPEPVFLPLFKHRGFCICTSPEAMDLGLALGSVKAIFLHPSLSADGCVSKPIPAGLCREESAAAPSQRLEKLSSFLSSSPGAPDHPFWHSGSLKRLFSPPLPRLSSENLAEAHGEELANEYPLPLSRARCCVVWCPALPCSFPLEYCYCISYFCLHPASTPSATSLQKSWSRLEVQFS